MVLPVNIESLIHGRSVEWERLEFKRGFNPEDVMRTMCAFANDLHNWGGGFIVIGIEENAGQPVFPAFGVSARQIDSMQKKVMELGFKISPNYLPSMQPYLLGEKHILVLYCPAGDNRPYTVPSTLGAGSQRQAFIRIGSSTVNAQGENLRRLQELTARIPFDDRINHLAKVEDLDLGLMQAYLQEIKSDLLSEMTRLSFSELCQAMNIVKGPQEDLRPVNAGLLFFSSRPDKFFPRAWIELVWHRDESGTAFKEHYFYGPLQKQLRDCLSFISSNILLDQVVKFADRAEAERISNFPFSAIEECLANAVYHKGYDTASPIEVQIWPDKIEILSHPGPVPPVSAETLRLKQRITAREYRNRRIGDFLKELRLTEGRATGLPLIYSAMERNGSPEPRFETDESNYFLVTLPVHKSWVFDSKEGKSNTVSNTVSNTASTLEISSLADIISFSNGAGNTVSNGAGNAARSILLENLHDRVPETLLLLQNRRKRKDLFDLMGLSNQTKNRLKYLDPLIELGWLEKQFPDDKTNPNQTYMITPRGQKVLDLIS